MQDQSSAMTILGPDVPGRADVLTREALTFVADLALHFQSRIEDVLVRRRERQAFFDAGGLPAFLPETREIREALWSVAGIPENLQDRRVEITGPPDRKMTINALNSGANVFMADFEDATSPTWANLISGQKNLMDAVRGTISHTDPKTGKQYRLEPNPATLFVRPRGLHLREKHIEFHGKPIIAPLFDFGIYLHHNIEILTKQGKNLYFYVPKLESHVEARLWDDIFAFAERRLNLAIGTIRATVLIETLPAAFEMDEILYEMRDHSLGLNCGRWDYIFSFIKTLRAHRRAILPDRRVLTMETPFLRWYSNLLIKTCHHRGTFAMGGMAAQIPNKADEEQNRIALSVVRQDKEREVRAGHDGTWVAHPGLVTIAREVFDQWMSGPNQIHNKREDVHVTATDLLTVPEGPRTEAELEHDIDVGLQYIAAWLGGTGCVPLYGLMEDTATAEICRAQIWQWFRHQASVNDKLLDEERLLKCIDDRVQRLQGQTSPPLHHIGEARELFERIVLAENFEEFMTTVAYERLSSISETMPAMAA